MTEQRKKRLQVKLQASRERLMDSHPFFALLLMYFRFVAIPDLKKISTNGRCIYFSADFIDKLYGDELDFVLCHQVMHVILGHIWRRCDLISDDYHFSCDILVNAQLNELGFTEDRYAHLGQIHNAIPSVDRDVRTLTAEEIYDLLPYSLYMFNETTRGKMMPDEDAWWEEKNDDGSSGEIIIDIPDFDVLIGDRGVDGMRGNHTGGGSSDGEEELKQLWHARATSTAKAMPPKGKSRGSEELPDFIRQMIERKYNPIIDWKRILNDFVQERICDYSFSPPDRRFSDTGFFLPDFNEKEFFVREILFMVDTSGSIRNKELSLVYSELRGAIEQFNGKLSGHLGFFDEVVTDPVPFESIKQLSEIIPHGNGGTDFRVIFEYIKESYENELPACIVVFTDGDGPYPKKAASLGIPVLWMINNTKFTPPWGRIARVIPKKKNY